MEELLNELQELKNLVLAGSKQALNRLALPMSMTFDLMHLKNMIMDMSELGAANYAKLVAPKSDELSERQAFKKFGEANVKRWSRLSLIQVKRMGSAKNSKKNYSYSELLAVKKSEKLIKQANELH